MRNKLMILLIIVLLTSFAAAFEMDLGGLQDRPVPTTQQAVPAQQTAAEETTSGFNFTDLLADATPESTSPADSAPEQVIETVPEAQQESIIDTTALKDNTVEQSTDTLQEQAANTGIDDSIKSTDEFGLAGKLSDSNFETSIAEMLQDSEVQQPAETQILPEENTPAIAGEPEEDLFGLAGRLKDPRPIKRMPGRLIGILKADSTEAEHSIQILRKTEGKTDLKINFTTAKENNSLLRQYAGPIREILIKGHDEKSPDNLLKIEQNLPRNITPFKSTGSFAIDPAQVNFTEMTLTFKASGSALYKCKAWNFTIKTCAPVQRDCTGEGKNETCTVTGGWTKIMSLEPGRTYTLNITPEDPAYAQYSSTLGAPECEDGESPCIATSSLLQSRDSLATPEPNQPNTIDACADGTSGTYLTDESVENITAESLNGSYFRQGDTIRVNASFYCWNTVNDNLNWVYTNSTSTISWAVQAFTDPCPQSGFYSDSKTFTLDNRAGGHAVRIINQYNGNTATTCGGGAYDDNDDLAFRVYTRVPPNVTNLAPVANSTYDVNDTVNISATAEDDETIIRYVKANITLPDGTSVLVNLSRKVIGEVLENRTINGSWRTINFTNQYDEPVVFASPLPFRNLRPAEVRITNVTSTGFTVRAQEPTGDYPEADNHSDEWPISILVMETGIHKFTDGSYVEVHKNLSTTTVSGSGPDTWTTYNYDLNWTALGYGYPIVLSQIQTYNSPRFVTTAKRPDPGGQYNVSIDISMEVAQDNSSAHPSETLGWMAIRRVTNETLNNTRYSSVLTADNIRGYDNGCYAAAHGLGTIPAAVIGMQITRDGGNGGWARYCSQTNTWTSTNTYWTIDEVDNGERAHTTERVAFVAFSSEANLTDDRYWETTFNQTSQRGRYNIKFIASDIPENINDTETTYFIIPTYPNVTLVSPPNATVQNTTTATFICNATDESGLENITFHLWNSTGGIVQSNTTIVSGKQNQSNITTTLLQGTYYWNCLATTVYGLSAFAPDNYTLIADITDPVVNISSPVNSTTYNTTFNIPLNFTAINGVAIDSCWYVLNAGAAVPITGCLNTTINVSAGQNNLTVYANDTAGNTGNDSVQFNAVYATTMLINTTKNPVENGERFYYYADYEYASNGSDVLNATCTVEQLNATDVRWHNGLDDAKEYLNTTTKYFATELDNLPANYVGDEYILQIYLALNSTGNKNLRIRVTSNQTSWNSTQAYNDTINTTTNPELNSTIQLINKTLNSSLFPAAGNYTIIISCDDCNSTDYYSLGKDTDNFGHSYRAQGAPVTWNNMTLDSFEHMMGLLVSINPFPLTYNSTNSRYERSAVQYLYSTTNFTYTYRINCSKTLHVNKTNKSTLTVANNFIPQPNITSIVPDPALLGIDDVTVTWTNDASGKAFGILESYVNLSYPNGTFIQKYQGHPFVIDKSKLTIIGNYTLTAYARNSIGSNTSNKTFEVIYPAPSVTILTPKGETYNNYRAVTIAANVTFRNGEGAVKANISRLDGTGQITLTKQIQPDTFDNSSQWQNYTWDLAPGQQCTNEITGGRMRIKINGTGSGSETQCGFTAKKSVYGDFNATIDYNITTLQDEKVFVFLFTEEKNRERGYQARINYESDAGSNTFVAAIEQAGNYTTLANATITKTAGTIGISRQNNTFTFYYMNGSTQAVIATANVTLQKGLYARIFSVSYTPTWHQREIYFDNFNLTSENPAAYATNYENTAVNGTYNVTIIANNSYGTVNDTEKTNFTITLNNTAPTIPLIYAPFAGEIIYGLYNITWEEVDDFQNDSIQLNITLLYENGSFYQNIVTNLPNKVAPNAYYEWNTSTVPNGKYKMRITAFENETAEKLSSAYTMPGPFIIDQEPPSVTILAPLNETFGENTTVVISANITDPDRISNAIASIDSPNGSQYNIILGKGLASQYFDNSSELNTTWIKVSDIAGSQACTVDINSTIPGRGFANLTGNGLPKTLTLCGVRSSKRVDGNFDINLSFWWEAAKQGEGAGMVWTMTASKTAGFGNKQIMIYYGNVSGVGTALRVYANDNGTTSVISQVPMYMDNGTARIVRQSNNFSVYLFNATAGNWTPIPLTRNYWNISRALYVQTGVASTYPGYSTAAASADDLNIISDNTTFGLFNRTEHLGVYNFTIIANDTLGRTNNTEKSNFTIQYINDPPSTPFLVTPSIGESVGGEGYNISWLPVTDPEGHSLQYNITLLNPDLSVNASIVTNLGPGNRTTYTWNTTLHNDGVYSMRITVFENTTVEKLSNSYTLQGNFTINNQKPSVIILAPLGQTFDQNSTVIISTNITSQTAIATATATVYSPNGSQYTVNLEKGLQSDDFENSSSINTTWIKIADIAGGQVCTADINGTIPGRGFANLSGNGFPNTLSLCGIGSMKRVDGNFDLNTTWYWEAGKQGVDSGIAMSISESKYPGFGNRQMLIFYGNISAVGTAIRVYANDNGTMQVISQVPIYLNNGSLRVTRDGNNFSVYLFNATAGNWTPIPLTKNIWNLSRALHVQPGVTSFYSAYSTAAASIEDVNIISSNTTFGLFNRTSQQGNYNTSIYVQDQYGGVNNTEKTNFTINYTNDPPSVPFILKPDAGDVWSLFNYIAWIQDTDPEGHTVQFNITLLNPDYTFNTTIASNFGNLSTDLYLWNTSTVPDAVYSVKVKVFENATPEKLSQSSTLLGNFTINNDGPDVFDLRPINGSTFPSGTTVLIGANVTDLVGVDTVLVNVTLPDNTIQQIQLNYTSGDWYELNFSNTTHDGTYKARFIANDTYGKINDTEITFFVIPNDAPNITVNSPVNGSNYTMNVFNITINLTTSDQNNDSLCVKVFASNETPVVNESYHLQARIGACYAQSTETVIYNWTSPVIQPDPDTVMLLHFDYDTSLGENTTHMYDFSGNGNNASCTPGSCPTYVSGKIGAALQYDPGEYVQVQDSPTLDGMNEISIEAWINASDISNFQIIDKNQSYEIYTDTTGHVIFKLFNPNVTVQSTSTIEIDKWHMIQATYNGSKMKLYLDGVLENTASRAGAVANTTGPLVIGVDAGDLASNGFEGIIDQAVVHNTSLSFDTIRDHYRLKNGTWYWYAKADDGLNSTHTGTYHINIGVNKKPSIAQVILNSTSGSNLPTDNLTRYVINATDADGSEIKNITDWRVNNKSYAVLNMPFEANNWNETAWTKDFTKYKNNGKVYDADWKKTGGYDGFGAYEFDGDRDYIFINKTCNGITEVTVTTWVKSDVTNTDNGIFMGKQPDGTDSACGLRYDAGGWAGGGTNLIKSGFTIDNGASNVTIQVESSNNTQTTGWQFIAVTWKSGEPVELYINGVKDTPTYQDPAQNGSISGTTGVYIGIGAKDTGATGWDGMIDEFVVYDKRLSDEQILALYNNRTDLIVSQETAPGETWQACVTPNDRRENGAQVCSNNLTIAAAPKVYPDLTLEGVKYLLNETAIIRANITSYYPIDTAYANVTLPNGTILKVNLTNTSAVTYEANFTNLWLRGRYNITFFANNTAGYENASETSWFKRVSLDYVDIINGSMNHHNFADYDAVLMSNYTGTLTLNITINSTRVPSIILHNHSEQSMHSVIRLSDYTNEDTQAFADSGWAIDLTPINMTHANVTAYAQGNHLLKCKNVSWTNLTCADVFNYTYVKAVQNGTAYTVLLNATDPIFITTAIGNNSINDSTLYERRPNNNYGALALLRIGRDPPANRDWKPIIRFNLTGIPENVTIINATMQLYFYNIPGGDDTGTRNYSIHKVQQNPVRDWKELQVTWNNYNTTNAWTNPGGDFGAATDTTSFNSTALNSYISWNVTADVQNFSDDRTRNFGWIIQDTVSTKNTVRDFRSKEVANASQRPKLIINFKKKRPDLLPLNISFSNNNPRENENITIYSTILNNGTLQAKNILVQFYDGNCTNGTQINGNITIAKLKKGENITINVTWIAFPIGPHNISVCVDPFNTINETNETNNNLTVPLNVQAWQTYYGEVTGNITLEDKAGYREYAWNATDNGTIYITDVDEVFHFTALQALGRNTTGGISTNDFADADANLNMTGFNDSIQALFAVNASAPKQTTTFTIINRQVQNVPYINSTNTSNFITGILWDTTNDINGEYGIGENETLVFVANINRDAIGKFGTYDYEIYIPRNLAKQTPATDRIKFYAELR